MVNAQKYISQKYPTKKRREEIGELYIQEQLENELDLTEFTNLQHLYISYFLDLDRFEIKNIRKHACIIWLKKAQEWLESQKEYDTKEKREKVEELDISQKGLEGSLDLSDFINLKKLDCSKNKLTSLNVNNCSNISTLYCWENRITDFTIENLKRLVELQCNGNQITKLNLSNNLNLEAVKCRNNHLTELVLDKLKKLVELGCSKNQLVDLDVKNCPSLEELDCSYNNLTGLNVNHCPNLSQLEVYGNSIEIEKLLIDYCPGLDKEKVEKVSNVKEYLDKNYPRKWTRRKIKKLDLSNQNLEGDLDLIDFDLLSEVNINNNPDLGEIKNKNLKTVVIGKRIIIAQQWLDKNYPRESRLRTKKINLNSEGLEGELDLSDFTNLEELDIENNHITNLNFANLEKLEKLYCSSNRLAALNFLTFLNSKKIKEISVYSNNFPVGDLTIFSNFINLKKLNLGNNKFHGSLEFLKKLTKLELLNISDTDVSSGYEYLPNNIREIDYFTTDKRPESKIKKIEKEILTWTIDNCKIDTAIVEQIKSFVHNKLTFEQGLLVNDLVSNEELKEKYRKFGLCKMCQQPNSGYEWCRFCNSSGNSKIDTFIQKNHLRADNSEKTLEWIPYEQFANAEYLAEGGFGKVYKARWVNSKDNKREEFIDINNKDSEANIVLKSLNNSRNINKDFLQEITCHTLFNVRNVVKCYGISQDPNTNNYLMVMEYIKGGNLRQYLDNHYDLLDYRDNLSQLLTLVNGLESIHEQGLIHRDLHPGNILNYGRSGNVECYITDLGLSRPANEESYKENVYGVLPYVAPEVLRGQSYTQATDIYSLGIIITELFSGYPPYYNIPHDETLAIWICRGVRPKFISNNTKSPPLLIDLIEWCCYAEPLLRPTASELSKILSNWCDEIDHGEGAEFYLQCLEAEEFDEKLPMSSLSYQMHSSASYTSRLLDFKNLPEPQNSKKVNDLFYNKELNDLFYNKKDEKVKKIDVLKEDSHNDCQISSAFENIEEDSEVSQEIKRISQSTEWKNISPNLTKELVSSWTNHNFTSLQTQDWLNIGLKPTDYQFASWLKNTKNLTPEQVLNHYNLEQLNQEFFNWWQEQQQDQVEQPPK